MFELKIYLWKNGKRDWGVEVNGRRYEHISRRIAEDLIEGAVIVAGNTVTREPHLRPN